MYLPGDGEAFLAQSEEAEIEIQDVGSYHAMLACVASGGYAGIVPQSVLETLTLPEASQLQPVGQAITQLIWRKGYASRPLRRCASSLNQLPTFDARRAPAATSAAAASSAIAAALSEGLNDPLRSYSAPATSGPTICPMP